MTLRVVLGPPCGGKSTYVRENAGEGEVRLDYDAIAQTLGASAPHVSDGAIRDVAQHVRREAIQRVIDKRHPAWIIHTWPTAAQRETYDAAGAEYVTCDPGIDETLARCEADNRPDGTREAIERWYEANAAAESDDEPEERTSMTSSKTSSMLSMTSSKTSSMLERRHLALDGGITRSDEAQAPLFRGHAAVFDSPTDIGDPITGWGWVETIGRNAFDATLDGSDVRLLVDHDTALLVARESAGDLRLAVDERGLAVDADLDTEVTYIADLARHLERGRITGMSFGFQVLADTWTEVDTEIEVKGEKRTIKVLHRSIDEIRLFEVSAVTFPAYPDTDAGLAERCQEIRAAAGHPIDPDEVVSTGSTIVEIDPHAERAAGLLARYPNIHTA